MEMLAMPAAILTAPVDRSAVDAVETIQSDAVVTKTRGLIQLKKHAEGWLCSTVIYGCETTFVPALIKEDRVKALFSLVNLGTPVLHEESIIAEFFDSEAAVREINEFGFEIAV